MNELAQDRGAGVERFLQDVLEETWGLFKADPVLYVLVSVLVILLGAVTVGVLAGPLAVGAVSVVRARRAGRAAQVSDVFEGLSRFGRAFVVTLLVAIGVMLGGALLVIPGLLVLLFTSFAWHEIAYRDASVTDALAGSYRIVKGAFLRALLLLLAIGVLNAIGGAVMFGVLLSAPLSLILLTVGYERLTDQGTASG